MWRGASVLYAEQMRQALRSILDEPRATPAPPRRVWRDWALVATVPVGVVIEFLVSDVTGPVVGVALAAVLMWALAERRTRPLIAVLAVVVPLIALNTFAAVTDARPPGLTVMALLLVLSYSLFRWGSGREMAAGFALLSVLLVTGLLAEPTTLEEVIAGIVFFFLPVELGAAIRYRTSARAREIDEMRSRERQQLARELHDTVAHHVSAIAIRAQAGRATAATDPSAPIAALEVIEREASLALTEMRRTVGVLRAGDAPDRSPAPRLADLANLERSDGAPIVKVATSGDLSGLGSTVETGIYRLAQESVTNALRHATNATTIEVKLVGGTDSVRLDVRDDGDPVPVDRARPGFGLMGMAERTALLGGEFRAGPGGKGWTVTVSIPRDDR